jgi:uncharacterized protein YycO
VSRLIRWQTRSEYSHASILLATGEHYEAREGKGVLKHARFTLTNKSEAVDYFALPLNAVQYDRLVAFLEKQVGKGYDWTMVARFVSRRQESRASTEKWFCSELAYAAVMVAGRDLLRETEPWEVSPGLLGRSPLLRKVKSPTAANP